MEHENIYKVVAYDKNNIVKYLIINNFINISKTDNKNIYKIHKYLLYSSLNLTNNDTKNDAFITGQLYLVEYDIKLNKAKSNNIEKCNGYFYFKDDYVYIDTNI